MNTDPLSSCLPDGQAHSSVYEKGTFIRYGMDPHGDALCTEN